jgi:HTH-type transcriptional regulator/antitoxin HipB
VNGDFASVGSVIGLGWWLRLLRKGRGWTQADLAKAAGVGVRFVVDLEAGKSSAQIGRVLRVANALGVEVRLAAPSETMKPRASFADEGLARGGVTQAWPPAEQLVRHDSA